MFINCLLVVVIGIKIFYKFYYFMSCVIVYFIVFFFDIIVRFLIFVILGSVREWYFGKFLFKSLLRVLSNYFFVEKYGLFNIIVK